MIYYHIFIFRRDLRINDNLALSKLYETIIKSNNNNVILPIFIFNSKQINKNSNKYFNKNSVQFLIQSLQSLDKQLDNKLLYIHTEKGDIDVLERLKNTIENKRPLGKLVSIYFNIDYTPFAIKRDEQIKSWCKDNNIQSITEEDYTLLPINSVLTNSGTFFSVFTPFYKKFLTSVSNIPAIYDINYTSDGCYLISTPKYTKHDIKLVVDDNINDRYFNSNWLEN